MTNGPATVLVSLEGLQKLEADRRRYHGQLEQMKTEKEYSSLEYLIGMGENRAYYIDIAGMPKVVEEENLSASAICSAVFEQGILNLATDLFAELIGMVDGSFSYYDTKAIQRKYDRKREKLYEYYKLGT